MTDIFVFGSNTIGVHGAGAARVALKCHGAKIGVGEGLQGNSYAIPTRHFVYGCVHTLPLSDIRSNVDRFLIFAREHPEMRFNVTRVGCGLAGYRDEQIAPMFAEATDNVILPKAWGGQGFDR